MGVSFISIFWRVVNRTEGAICERDSSGTTEAHERSEMREGDGADSPTRGAQSAPKRLAQIINVLIC